MRSTYLRHRWTVVAGPKLPRGAGPPRGRCCLSPSVCSGERRKPFKKREPRTFSCKIPCKASRCALPLQRRHKVQVRCLSHGAQCVLRPLKSIRPVPRAIAQKAFAHSPTLSRTILAIATTSMAETYLESSKQLKLAVIPQKRRLCTPLEQTTRAWHQTGTRARARAATPTF